MDGEIARVRAIGVGPALGRLDEIHPRLRIIVAHRDLIEPQPNAFRRRSSRNHSSRKAIRQLFGGLPQVVEHLTHGISKRLATCFADYPSALE
jgi:hypothetical protein